MLDLEIVDAHHHLWEGSAPTDSSRDPKVTLAFIGDESPIKGEYLPADLIGDASSFRLVGSVAVEAGPENYLTEAQSLQKLHSTSDLPSVIVAGADLLSADSQAHLESLAKLPAVRGVRDSLGWHPDPGYSFTARNDIITDPAWLRSLGLLERYSLSFDLQVYPSQLAQGARLAASYPNTQFVLVHTGMPIGSDAKSFEEWRNGIRLLSKQPNVSAKISGLGMFNHAWTLESIRPYVEEVIAAFGPDRSMFGSNFPVDSLYSSYTDLYSAFDELTRGYSRAERECLFSQTAMRIYRIPLESTRRVP